MRFRGGGVGHTDPAQYMSTEREVVIDGDPGEAEEVEACDQMEVDENGGTATERDEEEIEEVDGYEEDEGGDVNPTGETDEQGLDGGDMAERHFTDISDDEGEYQDISDDDGSFNDP